MLSRQALQTKEATTPNARPNCCTCKGYRRRGTNLPRNTEIVVYCGGPQCPLSRMAAEKLVKIGYENARSNQGELEEWKAAGLSIEKVITYGFIIRDRSAAR